MSNPNTAVYPAALATDNTLLVAHDDSTAFLSAPVGISDASVTLTDGSTFNTPCSLSIDAEILYSPSNVGSVFTVQRGFDGTTPTVHATGTAVFGNIIAWHHNQVSAEIKAIESTLGVNLSNIPVGVPPTRLINTTAPLTGGGNLSADRTLSIASATSSTVGVVKPDNTTISITSGVISAINTGTVTSVSLTMPAIFSVSGSPVTANGGFSVTLATESANTVWAGPTTGAAIAPTFRALVAADIPALPYVSPTRLINTTAPLAGGGDLSADRTLTIGTATTSVLGVVKPDGTSISIAGGVISTVTSGTVTRVDLTAPAEITVAGVPITSTGTIALTWANESANRVFAGPTTGAATTPTFRALVAADIPTLAAYVQTSRLINTTAPLAGGGNLTADLTLSVGTATTSVLGVVKPDGTTITIAAGVITAVVSGTGTVTSVDLTAPAEIAVSGVPITTSGTIALTWANETANFVFAGPTTGAAATPGFRALVLADIPALPYVPTARLINTTFPLAGGGNLSADLTLSVGTATTSVLGVVKPDGSTISIFSGIISAVNTGTVTSVTLTMPGIFSVSGSPITNTGTLAVTLATEAANTVWAGPTTGAATTPTFRALVAADIPALSYVPTTRLINTTAPLAGGGNLSADLTLSVGTATTSLLGVVQPDGTTITISGGVISSVGTVVSVGLAAPAEFVVSGSPVINTGVLTFTTATEPANTIWAGPTSGLAAQPSFRALVRADIPSLSYVTSVTLTMPGIFSVGGSPVTGAGTLAVTLATETANTVWAGPPTGAASAPTFRALVVADIPALTYVTSVALTMPAIFSVGGSPVTSAGTLAVTLATETANTVWAGPTTGAATTPTFRSLVSADIPALTYVTSVSLTMPAIFSVSGSPITSSGTFGVTLATETANTVWAGPTSGGATTPTFRALVNADMPGSGAGSGTVTSVSLTAPSEITVGGSPITASGTLALTWANEAANLVFAGPTTGGATTPAFRALVAADIPSLSYVPTARLINTTSPLAGGGDLSADRTLTVGTATTSVLGVVKPDGTSITIAAGVITAVASITLAGDVTGAASANTVAKLSNATASQAIVVDASKNVTSVAYGSTSAASSMAQRDANQNTFGNAWAQKLTNVTSAAGTTTLTNASSPTQVLTGTSTQTFVLPDATTLGATGYSFWFINDSTGLLTINKNGGSLLTTVLAGNAIKLVAASISTSGGGWESIAYVPTSISANLVFAGPTSGGAAAPTFRSVVAADLGTTLAVQFARVGIGTGTAPAGTGELLTIVSAGGTEAGLQVGQGTGGGGAFNANSANVNIYTYTGVVGSEAYTLRATINSTGLGLGTSSPTTSNGSIGRVLECASATTSGAFFVASGTPASNSSYLYGLEARSTGGGITGDARLGQINWNRITDVTAGKISSQFQVWVNNDGSLLNAVGIQATGTINLNSNTVVVTAAGSVGIGAGIPTSQLHLYGAAGTTTPAIGAGALYLEDSGGATGNGGSLLFGASQGYFAGIKGFITNGTSNTFGDLIFYARTLATDVNLTERMRIGGSGTLTVTGTLNVTGGYQINGTVGFTGAVAGRSAVNGIVV